MAHQPSVLFCDLAALSREIFSCFIQPEYPDYLYLFERRIHVQKMKIIKHLNTPFPRVYYIFESLLDCAQLRWRVKDHTTFTLCQDELTSIRNELDQIFMQMAKQITIETSNLTQKIERLEENYHHVLKATAREPLVFLLFIFGLKNMNEEIKKYGEAICCTSGQNVPLK